MESPRDGLRSAMTRCMVEEVSIMRSRGGDSMIAMLQVRGFSMSRLACAAWLLLFALHVPLYGQVTGATVNGTVTDTTGAVLSGAKIVIQNVATGVARDAVTDAAGIYVIPNLVP